MYFTLILIFFQIQDNSGNFLRSKHHPFLPLLYLQHLRYEGMRHKFFRVF